MKYKIIITKIDEVTKETTEYQRLYDSEVFQEVRAKDSEAKQYGYISITKTENVETKMYEQIAENTIDLKGIIDAFNKQPDNANISGGSGGSK